MKLKTIEKYMRILGFKEVRSYVWQRDKECYDIWLMLADLKKELIKIMAMKGKRSEIMKIRAEKILEFIRNSSYQRMKPVRQTDNNNKKVKTVLLVPQREGFFRKAPLFDIMVILKR